MASRLKRSNCPKWDFFSKSNKIFMYLFAPFIPRNIKRILWADPELSGCAIFSHKIAHLPWKNFFGTNQYYYFHLPLALFIVQNLRQIFMAGFKVVGMPHFWAKKNPSSGSRVMRMCNFWAYNGPFDQMRIFSENLLMKLVPFIRAKNQSQILIY